MAPDRQNGGMATTNLQWDAAVGTGLFRLAVGSGLIATAGFTARLLGAERDDSLVPKVVMGFGARDAALGMLALLGTRPGISAGATIWPQAAFDIVDAGVCAGLVATKRLPRLQGYGAMAISLASAIVDAAIARRANRPPGLSLAG
jgi:hypothetical protein